MIVIKYRKGYKYQLYEMAEKQLGILPAFPYTGEFIEITRTGLMRLHKGYAWDGPSGPTFDTLDALRGSLYHDGGYQLMRLGVIDRKYRRYIDHILYQTCIEDGMHPVRAKIWEDAVNLFAGDMAKAEMERPVLTAPAPYVINYDQVIDMFINQRKEAMCYG